MVYQQVGIDLGGAYTVWQYDKARKITAAEALPGDLVFLQLREQLHRPRRHLRRQRHDVARAAHRLGSSAWNGSTDKVYYARVLNQ